MMKRILLLGALPWVAHAQVESVDTRPSHIVGGQAASPEDYPYFAYGLGCGATLIRPDVLLSAAHCQSHFTSRAFVGAYDTFDLPEESATRLVVPHPDYAYSRFALENDIVLVFLQQPIEDVESVPYAQSTAPDNNESDLTVIGLGRLSSGGPSAQVLQEVTVQAGSQSQCMAQDVNATNFLADLGFTPRDYKYNHETMFCAGVDGGGLDSCQGDSGGPILNAQGIQVGIVSYGLGCAEDGYYGVYTRVSAYHEWIADNLCRHSVDPGISCDGVPVGDDEEEDDEEDSEEGGDSCKRGRFLGGCK